MLDIGAVQHQIAVLPNGLVADDLLKQAAISSNLNIFLHMHVPDTIVWCVLNSFLVHHCMLVAQLFSIGFAVTLHRLSQTAKYVQHYE